LGFLFTFIIGAAWGAKYYEPAFFSTVEPFLIFFFLLYFAVAVIFAGRARGRNAWVVDGTLVFGTPIAAFALQAGLVRGMDAALAWGAAVVGGLYLGTVRILLKRGGEELRMLVEAFFALGACFLTLAVPFAFDNKWTAAIWGLEGAAIFWAGLRQKRVVP